MARLKRIAVALIGAAAVGGGAGWVLSAPDPLPDDAFADGAVARTDEAGRPKPVGGYTPDAARGAVLFTAGGCASCHLAPGAEKTDAPELPGGKRFATEFGTFIAPNISPHETDGIGGWTDRQFADAMLRGVSPGGAHYYPAFPYASYRRMPVGDALDIFAHIKTLPPVAGKAPAHEVGFPFNIRRGLGLWKLLFAPGGWVVDVDQADPVVRRGRFLVEGPGHCGECHTPRNQLGGLDLSRWLQGGPNPDGPGVIPDISPGGLKWSAEDIAYYLAEGFTPEYDSVGGAMVDVVANTAKLTEADRKAIAAYLKALPAAE